MSAVYDTICHWAKKTSTSFVELRCALSPEREEIEPEGGGLIYRLKHWPELPASSRTADVFRALSVMSNRPVNRRWILTHSKLRAQQVDRLLKRLVDMDCVDVIDADKYRPGIN